MHNIYHVFRIHSVLLLLSGICIFPVKLSADKEGIIPLEVALAWEYPPGYIRIHYGDDEYQFGDLRIPSGSGPHPVAIMIHGGGWKAAYDISYFGKASNELTTMGIATWSLEYRRLGNDGGGWPGTFQDIANGADYLRVLAETYPLDLNRAIVIGHSAGGHLALWAGGRNRIGEHPELLSSDPVSLRGVLALAPATDLAEYYRTQKVGKADFDNTIERLLGGSPEQFPERYKHTSIVEMLPLGIRQIVVFGDLDDWTDDRYFDTAKAAGDDITMIRAPGAGHFELTDPDSTPTWNLVADAAFALLGMGSE